VQKIATLLSNRNRLYAESDFSCALSTTEPRISELVASAASVLTLVMSEANSNVNLDHISFNLFHYFYNKN
jgi:hypothetical protein